MTKNQPDDRASPFASAVAAHEAALARNPEPRRYNIGTEARPRWVIPFEEQHPPRHVVDPEQLAAARRAAAEHREARRRQIAACPELIGQMTPKYVALLRATEADDAETLRISRRLP
ncbi:MAG: hypothetical protein K5872_20910 [Rhizobiaceae bacterium]|nr:hypothetical protein [Rhizobiaceae bacterium]MCV0408678.1 hypothetical protein [Rhizobiaceae bacterium]